jgi:hypothetical protein
MVMVVSLRTNGKSVVAVRMRFCFSFSVQSKLMSKEAREGNEACSSRVF